MSSSTQDLLPQGLDVGNTFGALFIAVTLAAILFGITNVQAFIYFQTHRDTGMTLYKLIVICLWMLDALHLVLITHCVYYYLVINYAIPVTVLTGIVWSFKLQVVIDVLIIYGVHALYAYRIWIVSKGRSRVLPATVAMIVILGSGVAIALIWAIYQSHVDSDLIKNEWATIMTLGTIAFVDFVIALSLCYLLATSRTGFSSTDSLLTKLMVYIINTGCLTSISSMLAIITGAAMPNSSVSVGVEFLLAKLYVNSYLALLNAPYYLQPSEPETANISTFRAHRPSLHIRESEAEEVQDSRKDMVKHPYGQDNELYPVRPVQVVMQPIAMDSTTSFPSV